MPYAPKSRQKKILLPAIQELKPYNPQVPREKVACDQSHCGASESRVLGKLASTRPTALRLCFPSPTPATLHLLVLHVNLLAFRSSTL